MEASVQIIPAQKGDLKAILCHIRNHQRYDVEFARRYYELYFRNSQVTEKDRVYVAEVKGRIVGVIGFSRDYFSTDYSYWLGWFVVDKEYRGNKDYLVADNLLRKVLSELMRRGIKKLFVSTEDTNSRAKGFYANHGFRTEAVLRDYYYKGEDQLILSKTLRKG